MTARRGRKPWVVDTNAAVVANRRGGESYFCANSCAQALLRVKKSGLLLLDDAGEILGEYFNNCHPFGEPGFGSSFVKWIHDNQGRPELVQTIAITRRGDDPSDFEEFPKHEGLSKFDPSDRKFVAVANAHPGKPSILQATDSKWWGWKEPLLECGITVEFLCPVEIEEAYKRKLGQ